jgi:hypothetical protein
MFILWLKNDVDDVATIYESHPYEDKGEWWEY